MPTVTPELDRLAVATIRTLSIDAVQAANSGHPGAPDGRGADGVRPVVPVPQATLRPFPAGRTATGSSCRPGTPPRSSTRCSTWAATTFRSTS